MSEEKSNNAKITNLRAFAILMVAFGHAIIIFDPDWGIYHSNYHSDILQIVKHIINLIQMPLFFSISGYCFYYSTSKYAHSHAPSVKMFARFVKGKLKRIMIPFLIIAFLWMLPLRLLSHYPNWQDKSILKVVGEILLCVDSGHLWYLFSLFIMFLVSIFIVIATQKTDIRNRLFILLFILSIPVSVISVKIPVYFGISNACKYFWSFFLGFLVNSQNLEKVLHKSRVILLIVSIILAFINIVGSFNYTYLRIGVPLFSSIVFVMCFYSFNFDFSNPFIETISKDSFGIYLFHSPLLYPLFYHGNNLPPFIFTIISFGVLGAVSIIITETIRKNRWLRICIGE